MRIRKPLVASVLGLAFLLVGCATGNSPFMKTTVPPQAAFAGSGMAVVVIAAEQRARNFLIGEYTLNAELVFQRLRPYPVKVGSAQKTVDKRFFRLFSKGRAQAYAIPPGNYALVRIALYGTNPRLTYRTSGWSQQTGRPRITGFRVEAGEIVYLGNFYCDPPKGGVPLIMGVDDKAAEARKAVQIAFPGSTGKAMVERMTTRLLKVPTSAW